MYDVFDSFMRNDTWHTRHQLDQRRFFVCLGRLIDDPDFNPDALGEYMRRFVGVSQDNEAHPFNHDIDRYVSDAWAVKEYLAATAGNQ